MNEILKTIFAPVNQLMAALPISAARWVVMALFLAVAAAVWALPKKYVYLGAADTSKWRDLRVWTSLIMIPYILLYLLSE